MHRDERGDQQYRPLTFEGRVSDDAGGDSCPEHYRWVRAVTDRQRRAAHSRARAGRR